MIRRLRLKFVALSMALVTMVLAAVFLSVFFATRGNVQRLSRQLLVQVAEDGAYTGSGRTDLRITIDGSHVVLLPYFTVNVYPNSGGYLADVTGGTYSNLDNSEVLSDILQKCLDRPEDEGILQDYRLRYLRQDRGFYLRLAFVDTSMERAVLREMMGSYLVIAAGALALLLGVSVLLSRWATRPVEKAWRQQRQFLSDASHELKTPLTVILSNAELLEGAALEGRPARWADNIHSEARQMKSLVEEMLTLARSDDMGPSAVLTEVSLSDVADDCALAFEPVAFEAGKPLEDQIAGDVSVLGDRDKLRQLLSILLDNAIKYGREGQSVRLILERTDRQAVLRVQNTGDPIPPEQLSHLFERFYRADASRGEKSGFGLGLAIAKQIVTLHRGTIRAESAAGVTTFTCTLPLKKP
nr:HAMP domain-containing sensor histidine kinase [uncultured Dysosmobacter sp.]